MTFGLTGCSMNFFCSSTSTATNTVINNILDWLVSLFLPLIMFYLISLTVYGEKQFTLNKPFWLSSNKFLFKIDAWIYQISCTEWELLWFSRYLDLNRCVFDPTLVCIFLVNVCIFSHIINFVRLKTETHSHEALFHSNRIWNRGQAPVNVHQGVFDRKTASCHFKHQLTADVESQRICADFQRQNCAKSGKCGEYVCQVQNHRQNVAGKLQPHHRQGKGVKGTRCGIGY